MVIGRLNDYDSMMLIEKGFNNTHITLEGKGQTVEIELDKYKLEKLIQLLNQCK